MQTGNPDCPNSYEMLTPLWLISLPTAMLQQSQFLIICFNIPMFLPKKQALFGACFEAFQITIKLLQQKREIVEAIYYSLFYFQQLTKYVSENRV